MAGPYFTINGPLYNASGPAAECCCVNCCLDCSDGTPQTLTVTIAGTTIITCVDCAGGGSIGGPGGTYDGVYTLTKVVGECRWTTTFTTGAAGYYTDAGCTGTFEDSFTEWRIDLELLPWLGGLIWRFGIYGVPGLALRQSMFIADDEAATGECAANFPTFGNIADGTCSTLYFGGFSTGGTAVISFEHGTDTFVEGCAPCQYCDDVAPEVLQLVIAGTTTAASGCAACATSGAMRGLGAGTIDGTYPLYRTGEGDCCWVGLVDSDVVIHSSSTCDGGTSATGIIFTLCKINATQWSLSTSGTPGFVAANQTEDTGCAANLPTFTNTIGAIYCNSPTDFIGVTGGTATITL